MRYACLQILIYTLHIKNKVLLQGVLCFLYARQVLNIACG